MPDQNTASTEHALIQELTAPLASLPDDPVPEMANVDFPLALRGYDRIAVDAYVKRASQLVAELNAGRSPRAAVRRALERVGEDVSGILQRAHDTAERITAQSRIEAEDRLEAARQEADALLSDARGHLTELDAETDRIWAERQRIVEDTRSLASQLLALAEAAVERFPVAEEHTVEVPRPVGGETGPDDETPASDAADPDAETRVQGEIELEGDGGAAGEDEATAVLEPVDPFDHEAE